MRAKDKTAKWKQNATEITVSWLLVVKNVSFRWVLEDSPKETGSLLAKKVLGTTLHTWKTNLCKWKHLCFENKIVIYFHKQKEDEENIVQLTNKLDLLDFKKKLTYRSIFQTKFNYKFLKFKAISFWNNW